MVCQTPGVRRELGDGWTIDLPDDTGCSLRTGRFAWRDGSALDIMADLEREVPPGFTGKLAEGGAPGCGVGVRAAWLYADGTLHGYSFAGGECLETVLNGTNDPAGALAAWRSVRHAPLL